MPTRSVWVTTSGDRLSSLAFFSADPLTRRLARVKYIDWGWDLGLHTIPASGETERLWALATQLRSVLAGDADVTVSDTTYQGRPAWRVAVAAEKGSPGWYAIVDKEHGITLAVRPLPQEGTSGATSGATSGGDGASSDAAPDLIAFHVTKLRVNEALPAGTFVIRPSYDTAQRLKARCGGTLMVKRIDFMEGSPAVHYYPPDALRRVASGTELVPADLPAGYRLAEIARWAKDTAPAVLVYRRGMSEFIVGSGPRTPGMVNPSADATPAPGIAAFDRGTWPQLHDYDEFTAIHGGALNGAPAMLFAGVGAPASLFAWTDTRDASVRGGLSRAELLAVAASLRPLSGGTRAAWRASLLWSLALIVALLVAALTAAAWLTAGRRRREADARSRIGVLAWPLIGVVLVFVGAFLSWHTLLHNGPAFRMSGWDEPLGRVVAALAIAAVSAAAWWLLARGLARLWLKTLAQALAGAALVGAVVALVYLPPQARFLVSPNVASAQTGDPADESWLLRIADSQFSPSAATGLYVAILGALVLFVGVLLMRRRDPTPGAPLSKPSAE